jgi:magnesium-transporting ATPase (P-type)
MTYDPHDQDGTTQTNIQAPPGGTSGAALFAIGLVIVAIALLVWFFVANDDNNGGATQTSQPTATTVATTLVPTSLPDATTTPAP